MESLSQKRCTKCGELKPVREFVKDPQKKDGYYSSCRQCYRVKYLSNREKEIARVRDYQQRNHESLIAYKKEYYKENREREIQKMAVRREKRKDADKEYRDRNREKLNAYSALWASLNKVRLSARLKLWRKNNPEKTKAQKSNRHARERGAAGTVTAHEWEELKRFYNYTCLCCKRREPEIKLTQDHVIPVSMGGEHSIKNLQPLCGSCNSKKSKKHIDYR